MLEEIITSYNSVNCRSNFTSNNITFIPSLLRLVECLRLSCCKTKLQPCLSSWTDLTFVKRIFWYKVEFTVVSLIASFPVNHPYSWYRLFVKISCVWNPLCLSLSLKVICLHTEMNIHTNTDIPIYVWTGDKRKIGASVMLWGHLGWHKFGLFVLFKKRYSKSAKSYSF